MKYTYLFYILHLRLLTSKAELINEGTYIRIPSLIALALNGLSSSVVRFYLFSFMKDIPDSFFIHLKPCRSIFAFNLKKF